MPVRSKTHESVWPICVRAFLISLLFLFPLTCHWREHDQLNHIISPNISTVLEEDALHILAIRMIFSFSIALKDFPEEDSFDKKHFGKILSTRMFGTQWKYKLSSGSGCLCVCV